MREQLRAAHSRSYREFLEYRFYGAEGQNRTVDTSLFRAVLYQLSYLGTTRESLQESGGRYRRSRDWVKAN